MLFPLSKCINLYVRVGSQQVNFCLGHMRLLYYGTIKTNIELSAGRSLSIGMKLIS
jgi:hypothetical protein